MVFYDLLKDPVFVDYFNVFLSLPVSHTVFILFCIIFILSVVGVKKFNYYYK